MDFLKKAKRQMQELEKDLNKATKALGLGDSQDQPESTDEPAETPETTEDGNDAKDDADDNAGDDDKGGDGFKAPKVPKGLVAKVGELVTAVKPKEGAPEKLSLLTRKSVRDDFESKRPKIEEQLTEMLKTPWTIVVDTAPVLSYAQDGWAAQNPGSMLNGYFEGAVDSIKSYLEAEGDDGRDALNQLAAHHVITVEPDESVSTCGGDIKGGKLRVLFHPQYLGYNSSDPFQYLSKIVNAADAAALGPTALPFLTRQNLKREYEAKIGAVQDEARKELAMPALEFVPNFEANYAAIKAYSTSTPEARRDMPQEWDDRLGSITFEYFQGFAKHLKYKKFGADDMMQEGFRDAVTEGRVELRVVDRLEKATYNECAIHGGVLYLQTTPRYWYTNVDDVSEPLLGLL